MRSGFGRAAFVVAFGVAALGLSATDRAAAAPCLKETDAVSGDLRKVTSRRPSNGQLVINWHIITSSPLCVKIDDSRVSDVLDIQIVFKNPEDEAAADDLLGTAVGFKGRFVNPRDDADTGWVVLIDAEFMQDLDDAGEVRR